MAIIGDSLYKSQNHNSLKFKVYILFTGRLIGSNLFFGYEKIFFANCFNCSFVFVAD